MPSGPAIAVEPAMVAENKAEMEPPQMDGQGALPRFIERAKEADDMLVAFVTKRPLVALGAALAFGYVIGRIMSRRD